MNKVFIQNIDLQTKYDAYLEGREITAPQVRRVTETIPGRNGTLDYTTAITGYPTYENRTIRIIICIHKTEKAELEKARDDIYKLIHGQGLAMKFNDIKGEYKGIGTVEAEEDGLRYKRLTISVDAYPYRFTGITKIELTATAEGVTKDFEISMPVSPYMENENEITIEAGNIAITKKAGKFSVDELVLKPGHNQIKIKGTGKVKMQYEEGVL
jgi:phage-related protein